MKIRLLGALVGLAISFALSTFAQQKETVDPQIAEQVNAVSKKFEEANNNNDAAALAALFTADAVFVTTEGPVYGRQAIEEWWVNNIQQWHHSNHIRKPDTNSPRIIGTPDVLASTGEWSETVQGKTGEPIQHGGYWSDIYAREGNDWKIRMLTGNINPAAGAPSQTK